LHVIKKFHRVLYKIYTEQYRIRITHRFNYLIYNVFLNRIIKISLAKKTIAYLYAGIIDGFFSIEK